MLSCVPGAGDLRPQRGVRGGAGRGARLLLPRRLLRDPAGRGPGPAARYPHYSVMLLQCWCAGCVRTPVSCKADNQTRPSSCPAGFNCEREVCLQVPPVPVLPWCNGPLCRAAGATPSARWGSAASPASPPPAGSASRSASTTPTAWPASSARRTSVGPAAGGCEGRGNILNLKSRFFTGTTIYLAFVSVGRTATVRSVRSAVRGRGRAQGSARRDVTSVTTAPSDRSANQLSTNLSTK